MRVGVKHDTIEKTAPMHRTAWLIAVLAVLLLLLGGVWYWFLRFACDDDWCLLLEARKKEVQHEQQSNRNSSNANRTSNANTAVNTNTLTNTQANIQISQPQPNDRISSPFRLSGKAREFENVFNYRLKDEDGTVLAANYVQYVAEDTGMFGDFSILIAFDPPSGERGTLEVFTYSPRDGSEIDKVRIPVVFE